ncbi:hypothetical protein LV779_33190 [Streptomyces thinghirensis]|nr:hypothetical protein [Streptomyces thinghirensis]
MELSAIEDHAFHKLLDTAQYGAASARRMIMYGTRVVNAMISLIAAAGVLTVLHPALLPLLVTMTLPSAWSALTLARRRYESFHAWVQHERAGRLLGSLAHRTGRAPEIRVHGVGPSCCVALPRHVGDRRGGAGPTGPAGGAYGADRGGVDRAGHGGDVRDARRAAAGRRDVPGGGGYGRDRHPHRLAEPRHPGRRGQRAPRGGPLRRRPGTAARGGGRPGHSGGRRRATGGPEGDPLRERHVPLPG